jgi:hypothetical protein
LTGHGRLRCNCSISAASHALVGSHIFVIVAKHSASVPAQRKNKARNVTRAAFFSSKIRRQGACNKIARNPERLRREIIGPRLLLQRNNDTL